MANLEYYPYSDQNCYYESDTSLPPEKSTVLPNDTLMLLGVCGLSVIVSGILYALTRNPKVSAAPAGLVCLLCALIHTPLAFLFLYSVLPFEILYRPSEAFTISKLMGVVVVVSFLLTRLGAGLRAPRTVKWLLLFGFFCLLSVLWALLPLFSLIGVATILLHVGLIFLLVNTIKSRPVFRLVLWGFVLASAAGACLALLGVGSENMSTDRVTLGDQNPNVLGGQFAVAVIAAIYLMLEARWLVKLVCLGLSGLMFVTLVFIQSRSALLSVFMGPALALILLMKGRNIPVYLVLFLLLCGGGLVGYKYLLSSRILGDKATERLSTSQYALEESGRLHFWKEGIRYLGERPLTGYGYRNYMVRYGGGVMGRDAHNSYVSIAAELGLGGLFIFLMVHVLLFRGSMRLPTAKLKWFALALLLFTILNGMTHTTYNQKDFWYAIGFIALLCNLSESFFYDAHWPTEYAEAFEVRDGLANN